MKIRLWPSWRQSLLNLWHTTCVRTVGSILLEREWIPATICLRPTGMLVAKWWHSTTKHLIRQCNSIWQSLSSMETQGMLCYVQQPLCSCCISLLQTMFSYYISFQCFTVLCVMLYQSTHAWQITCDEECLYKVSVQCLSNECTVLVSRLAA